MQRRRVGGGVSCVRGGIVGLRMYCYGFYCSKTLLDTTLSWLNTLKKFYYERHVQGLDEFYLNTLEERGGRYWDIK